MHVPVGDFVTEVLDHKGEPIPGAIHIGTSLTVEQSQAPAIANAYGANRWRIMRCVASSDEGERWDRKPG